MTESTRDLDSLRAITHTPCYVLERDKLIANLNLLESVQHESGAKILLALKGYAFWRCFEEVRQALSGSTASGLYEARLGYEEVGGREQGKEVCVFSPAYKEIDSLLSYATHIIFNSFAQWQKFKPIIEAHNTTNPAQYISIGLRVNPLYSEVTPEIYNPCAPNSRLGIIPSEFAKGVREFGLDGIEGLHFHTHCEQNSDALQRTLPHFIKYFGQYLEGKKWVNFGGGHHITRKDYDVELLIKLVRDFRVAYDVEVFLEPGEAVGWQVGFLIGNVIDIVQNQSQIAILDVSASAHMPDCLEMPYRPSVCKMSNGIIESDRGENVGAYRYRFGGPTCLAGDVIGDFSFDTPLCVGDKVIFEDMLHYTIVKNNTFNGVPLPSLGVIENGKFRKLKEFDYLDYKQRN
ncbi:carboxynorspermidine decarboxylase [uncultured Helicobacter sp.]|uniref:carboxynorspermidine decarboxylase n=1 Tax=uncultured Helicobacter sp. TaxID=175537 RepID=UPI001C3B741E|nr:carboxynorspermidine decarboxylase [Candidatus Helicobacter avicola]